MKSQFTAKTDADGHGLGEFRATLKSWISRYARGKSLPIAATLVVLLLGLPDELVDVMRELPCTAIEECCDQLSERCATPASTKAADGGQLTLITDQFRDVLSDWFFRIWTLFF